MDEAAAEIFLIEEHWRELGIENGWPIEKFDELAHRLGFDPPYRLGLLIGLRRYEYNQMKSNGKVTRVVAHHCCLLEAFFDGVYKRNFVNRPVITPLHIFQ